MQKKSYRLGEKSTNIISDFFYYVYTWLPIIYLLYCIQVITTLKIAVLEPFGYTIGIKKIEKADNNESR